MKLSQRSRDRVYAAIHRAVVDARISLALPPKQDAELAQLESRLWRVVQMALDPRRKERPNE